MSTRRKFEDLKALICKLAALELPEEVQVLRSRVENEFARAINGDDIYVVWGIEDVHETAKQVDAHLIEDPDDWKSPLSDEEAREILAITERQHDASIGVNWDVLAVHVRAKLDEKRQAAREKGAMEALEKIKGDLQAKYPHLNVSFGYIGNMERWGDDRSWRFFYNPESGACAKSFGGYATASLPKFAKYMQGLGLEVFEKILARSAKRLARRLPWRHRQRQHRQG
jgi:hypothetical protein